MGSILYRFELELADQDRQRFGGLSLRVSQHPSEQASRMILRVLARALEDE